MTSIMKMATTGLVLLLLAGVTSPSASSPTGGGSILIADAAATVNKTICALPLGSSFSMVAAHAYYAANYYAAEFPNINWIPKYVNVFPGSAADMVRSWVLNGASCDAVIGPASSARAVAMSPLVTIPWLDPAATSTELSDKTSHPTFSRVIPTDEVGAQSAAVLYAQFGWNSTNILCADEPYGRSVSNGVLTSLQAQGGSVDVSICLERSATGERVTSALDQFYASKTRVIFLVVLVGDLLTSFTTECQMRNCTNDFIFVFPENSCPDRLEDWPGSMCTTYLSEPHAIAPFLEGYFARDLTQERMELEALGFPNTTNLNEATHLFAQFSHDAAYHAMSALSAYVANNSYGDVIDFVRAHQSQGATGLITMDESGDRPGVDVAVYNTNSTGHWTVIGTIKSKKFEWVDTNFTTVVARPNIFLMNQTFADGATLPTVYFDEIDTVILAVTDSNALTVGIVCGCVILVMLVAAGPGSVFLRKSGQRELGFAPKDATKPFAMVFTDVQSSTALWSRIPVTMSDAVESHHTILRKELVKHRGYEVKTVGDCFMVAFVSVDDAVRFGAAAQLALFKYDWNDAKEIENTYHELAGEKDIAPVFQGNGIRIRIGLHFGEGQVVLDETTKAYDYYGTVVNTAARVEAVGNGGQFLITDSALMAINAETKEQMTCLDLGEQPLRGLDHPVRVHQIALKNETAIQARTFPELALAKADEVQDGGEEKENTASDSRSVLSLVSGRSAGAAVEQLAQKHAKRAGNQHAQQVYCDRLLEFQSFAKVLFSTSDRQFREKTTKHLSTKWRVPIGGGFSVKELSNDIAYQATLLDVAVKVMGVVDAKNRDAHQRQAAGMSFRGDMSGIGSGMAGSGMAGSGLMVVGSMSMMSASGAPTSGAPHPPVQQQESGAGGVDGRRKSAWDKEDPTDKQHDVSLERSEEVGKDNQDLVNAVTPDCGVDDADCSALRTESTK